MTPWLVLALTVAGFLFATWFVLVVFFTPAVMYEYEPAWVLERQQ